MSNCVHKFVWPNGDCVDCRVLATTVPGHTEPHHYMVPRNLAPLIAERQLLHQRLNNLQKYGAFSHLLGCNTQKTELWDEAQDALLGIPVQDRDEAWLLATDDVRRRRAKCDCGFEEAFEKKVVEVHPTNLERYGHLADHGKS